MNKLLTFYDSGLMLHRFKLLDMVAYKDFQSLMSTEPAYISRVSLAVIMMPIMQLYV